ncbi:hypothetical protein MYFR107205_08760 [Mycolicibacterium frederiksbergense]
MVSARRGLTPVFHATSASIDRQPVAPHNEFPSSVPLPSISATISTNRPSIALRCPVNSAISSNNTSNRDTRGACAAKGVVGGGIPRF